MRVIPISLDTQTRVCYFAFLSLRIFCRLSKHAQSSYFEILSQYKNFFFSRCLFFMRRFLRAIDYLK
jgi:hypothetical protein